MQKVRILFYQWKLVFGGTESALFDLLHLLDKDQFDVALFTVEEGGIWEQKFIDSGIRVINPFSDIEAKKNTYSPQEYNRRYKKIKKSLENNCIGLLNVCTSEKWDIIVSYHGAAYRLGVFQKKAKTIFYIHVDSTSNVFVKNDIIDSPGYYRAFDKIIAVSDFAKKSFVNVSGFDDNIEVHLNPIIVSTIKEKSLCPVADETYLRNDFPLVCTVGRLSKEKGFDRLIKIHKRLIDEGIMHRLVIVGEGDERETLEQIIEDTKTENTVLLAGYQSNPYPIIANSKMLIVSSFHEGLSMTAMEAVSLGIPVVSSVPTVKEIFGELPCGIVTEKDDDSLYLGIRKMLSDEEFYCSAKKAAIKRSEYYIGDTMIKEIEKSFLDTFKQKRKNNFFDLHKEYFKLFKRKNRDLKHLPNRILMTLIGKKKYEKIKSRFKH